MLNSVRLFVLFFLLMALPCYSAVDFQWNLDKDTDDEMESPRLKLPKSKTPPPEKRSVSPTVTQPAVDSAALKKLIDDNLMLRKKIAQSEQDSLATQQKNVRLSAQIRSVEQSLTDSIAKIQNLNKQKSLSEANTDKVLELEGKLSDAELDKQRISGELSDLRKRIADVESVPVVLPDPVAPVSPSMKPNSDLFKELEKENLLLKEKWVDVETQRQKAVKDFEKIAKKNKKAEEDAATAALSASKAKARLSVVENDKKDLNALLRRLPGLEKELCQNKTKVVEKELELAKSQKSLNALMIELERRENRLIKAERMQKIMEEAREDLRRVSNAEKRDMHYNMAAVYAKEGRFRFAEREYLRALQVDPNDAGVHYNLGILYDDDMKNKRRATIHYKKYLKLNPYGPDADEVKGWLMQIELAK